MKVLVWMISVILTLAGCGIKGKPGKFEVGDRTFLLNGQPFMVKAAEIHYTRIPYEYWEHRIRMCKAMGMNTICIYVFWNIHEQNPGEFNFEGQNDIAEFCRLAQEQEMWVIVRPGPYVCAEWEMGGLPWWLLQKEDIELRTNDPYFMERTRLFMNEVGKQLADRQITRGGNIIMVQVENEYGSYGEDKAYVAAIRDMVKEAGFTEVPLFQCDWNSNFQLNALDDLLWTINFGTGANIEKQFEKLKELRPNSPLMCSEFWSGWFDHWGRPHETRSTEALVEGMKDMLDRNISFSLYMAHGGTTFGQWGGANCPPYSTMCSSYDYNAPIDEAGQPTEKFYAVRELLGKYLPEGEILPEVPAALPMIEIPEFSLSQVAPLFENLPEKGMSETIRPMEQFNQGWGTILYRTTLPAANGDGVTLLTVDEAHDWAQVFVDGKKVGVLDRRRGEKSLKLPAYREGAVLDILVEAMGRVNFAEAIHDRKGITRKVELKQGEQAEELKHWEIYRFPVDVAFVRNKNYRESPEYQGPAYYKGDFELKETGDVFLNMQSWGKGMVWVNGHNLGRMWKIGPQQTMFLPGCWLKKGKNEILVLDLEGPEKAKISGQKTPILDQLRPDESLLHRTKGQQLDLSGEKPLHVSGFKPGNGWQKVVFRQSADARYFCLEALNSYGDDPYAAIAELDILGPDRKPLSRANWKIVYADSEEVSAANNAADKIYDLQESTFWHTAYSGQQPKHPHQIVVDLGEVTEVTGFRYLPRAEANLPGMIKDYRIFVKTEPFKY